MLKKVGTHMKKSERQVEVLLESLIEVSEIEKVIESLPRGYISVKTISGHTYYYRQWREGEKIISSYVPESYLNVVSLLRIIILAVRLFLRVR